MTTWPTDTLIHITAGEVDGNPIKNELAKNEPHYSDEYPNAYTILTGPQARNVIIEGYPNDNIWEWEVVTLVPTAVLADAQLAFHGVKMTDFQREALQALGHYIN